MRIFRARDMLEMALPKSMTIAEICEYLEISKAHFHYLKKQAGIEPVAKFKRESVFSREDVDKLASGDFS